MPSLLSKLRSSAARVRVSERVNDCRVVVLMIPSCGVFLRAPRLCFCLCACPPVRTRDARMVIIKVHMCVCVSVCIHAYASKRVCVCVPACVAESNKLTVIDFRKVRKPMLNTNKTHARTPHSFAVCAKYTCTMWRMSRRKRRKTTTPTPTPRR